MDGERCKMPLIEAGPRQDCGGMRLRSHVSAAQLNNTNRNTLKTRPYAIFAYILEVDLFLTEFGYSTTR